MKSNTTDPRSQSQRSSRTHSLTSHRRMLHLINSHDPAFLVDQSPKVFMQNESTWAVQDEERTDVGQQLTNLRKKHDLSRTALGKNDTCLQSLRSELKQLNVIEEKTLISAETVQERIKRLEAEIEQTRNMREDTKDQKYIYEHVLTRMQKTRISLELQAQTHMQALKTRQLVVSEQLRRMRTSQASSSIARQAVDVARNLLTREEQQQESQALTFEKNARLRKEIASRRDERQIHQAEIAELAANMQEDGEETRLRRGYLLHRFWWNALHRKLEKDKAQSVDIEEAFQKIKIATGLGDVHDMVERFLTKEQTYSRLMQAVTEAEQRVERLKREIEEEQGNIKSFVVSEQKGREDMDVSSLNLALAKELKEVQSAQEKLKKHEIAYDHIAEWTGKVYTQLYRVVHKDLPVPSFNSAQNYLPTLFNSLTELVQELLEPIKAQREAVIQAVDSQDSKKIEEIIEQSPLSVRKVVRVRAIEGGEEGGSDQDSGKLADLEAETMEELLELRRKQKQFSWDRVESARRKKLKEKKQEGKKE